MKQYLTLIGLFLLSATTLFAQQNEPPQIPKTTIVFEEVEFDFGQIESGEKVSYIYQFKNTGNEPLIITKAKGSCGCTVPYWPKEPIPPGGGGEIEVTFNSKNKKGKQSKRVTITANTDPAQTFLTIKGEVLKKPEAPVVTPPATPAVSTPIPTSTLNANAITLFPNPSTEYLHVDLKSYLGQAAQIEIFNELGQEMTTQEVKTISVEPVSFDVRKYPAGSYTVSVRIGEEGVVTKVFLVGRE